MNMLTELAACWGMEALVFWKIKIKVTRPFSKVLNISLDYVVIYRSAIIMLFTYFAYCLILEKNKTHSRVLKKIHTVRWCKVIISIHISFIWKPTDGSDPALTSVDIKSSHWVTGRSWTKYTDVKIKQSICVVFWKIIIAFYNISEFRLVCIRPLGKSILIQWRPR